MKNRINLYLVLCFSITAVFVCSMVGCDRDDESTDGESRLDKLSGTYSLVRAEYDIAGISFTLKPPEDVSGTLRLSSEGDWAISLNPTDPTIAGFSDSGKTWAADDSVITFDDGSRLDYTLSGDILELKGSVDDVSLTLVYKKS